MYFKHRTVDEVIKELEEYRDSVKAKIDVWKTVEIKKKKNGEEFAKLSQAVVNAHFGKYTPVEDFTHPYLTVICRSGRWFEDSVQAFYYVDELSVEDRNREVTYNKNSWSRETSPMNAAELRKAITDYIDKLEKHKISLEKQIANAPVLFENYRKAIEKAEKELEAADKEIREKDIYPTSLYYCITATR